MEKRRLEGSTARRRVAPPRPPARALPRARRGPSRAVKLAASLAIPLLLLGGLEGASRWRERRRPPARPDQTGAEAWRRWGEFQPDEQGGRGYALEKPAGRFRWVFLSEGSSLEDGTASGEPYPRRLQALFDEEGRPVEVFHLAGGGWSTRQQRAAYTQVARRYRPDRVELVARLDDIPDRTQAGPDPPPSVRPLYARSAAVRWLVGAAAGRVEHVEDLFTQPDSPRVTTAFERFFGEVRGLRDVVERDGAAFGLLVMPASLQLASGAPRPSPQEHIAAFCAAEHMECRDLLPVLSALGDGGFGPDGRLGAEGARLLAEELRLRGQGLATSHPEVLASLPAVEAAQLLDAERLEVRAAAAWKLGRAPGPDAADWLVLALKDPEEAVRREAVQALGRLRAAAPDARFALFRALEDPRESVRRAATGALFSLDPTPADRPRLMGALSSRDAYVRAFAAFKLGTQGPGAPNPGPTPSP